MNWLTALSSSQPVAWAVLALMLVAVTGLLLSHLKIKGIGLGVTGVLFTGITLGHFGLSIDERILEFVRDFGLILFVFTIGLQLGPGFFASFRKQGLTLNLLAATIILLGAGVTIGAGILFNVNPFASVGLFSGATTNTPSLGATQQMLKSLAGAFAENAAIPPLAYAAAYPGAVAGIISVILLLRWIPGGKSAAAAFENKPTHMERMNVLLESPGIENVVVGEIPDCHGVAISRIKRAGISEVETATDQMRLHRGDIVLAIGAREALDHFRNLAGRETNWNLLNVSARILSRRMVVTRNDVLGKALADLNLSARFGAVVTRLARGEIEMTALHELKLQFGDTLQIVGSENALDQVADLLGNRAGALLDTNFIPIFIGIALGVIAGVVPISVPHIPVPVQLGIAGGPLVLAIILSRIGRVGPLVWYMPPGANAAFRELGIVLFLACVGLKAGAKFFETVFTTEGAHWLFAGLAITMVPLLLVALSARCLFKLNSQTISGVLAGSMTDPPALAFAHALTPSDAPLVAYATVYPLSMLLRIFAAQILVIILCR